MEPNTSRNTDHCAEQTRVHSYSLLPHHEDSKYLDSREWDGKLKKLTVHDQWTEINFANNLISFPRDPMILAHFW